MKSLVFALAIVMIAGTANAQKLDIPAEHQEAAKKVFMRLAFADGCNKRLDRPDIYKDAKSAFLKFANRIGLADADSEVERVSKMLADQPQQKEEGPITLFNPKLCGQLSDSLKKELAE